jgi:non-ribosomal peptide synthetase component E (peptide arylation enzyme)
MPDAELPPGWPAMSIQQAHALIGQPGLPTEVGEETINGVRLKVWKNQPPTLRAVAEMAKAHGDKVFLVYEDERVTFEAFHRAVAALAAQLRADGVGKGDRVAVIMRNLPDWPVAWGAMPEDPEVVKLIAADKQTGVLAAAMAAVQWDSSAAHEALLKAATNVPKKNSSRSPTLQTIAMKGLRCRRDFACNRRATTSLPGAK